MFLMKKHSPKWVFFYVLDLTILDYYAIISLRGVALL